MPFGGPKPDCRWNIYSFYALDLLQKLLAFVALITMVP